MIFGDEFNQPIDNLPKNLTVIAVGWKFNQSTENLPSTITELSFYSNNKIKNNIPINAKFLNIYFCEYDEYNETIENISCNIKNIKINRKNKIHYLKKIPFGCTVTNKKGEYIL